MNKYVKLVEQTLVTESIEDEINVSNTQMYPKVDFVDSNPNQRQGLWSIKGESILGSIQTTQSGPLGITLLVPDQYDYEQFGHTLKKDEILVRMENQLTKRVNNSNTFLNATIGKVNPLLVLLVFKIESTPLPEYSFSIPPSLSLKIYELRKPLDIGFE